MVDDYPDGPESPERRLFMGTLGRRVFTAVGGTAVAWLVYNIISDIYDLETYQPGSASQSLPDVSDLSVKVCSDSAKFYIERAEQEYGVKQNPRKAYDLLVYAEPFAEKGGVDLKPTFELLAKECLHGAEIGFSGYKTVEARYDLLGIGDSSAQKSGFDATPTYRRLSERFYNNALIGFEMNRELGIKYTEGVWNELMEGFPFAEKTMDDSIIAKYGDLKARIEEYDRQGAPRIQGDPQPPFITGPRLH